MKLRTIKKQIGRSWREERRLVRRALGRHTRWESGWSRADIEAQAHFLFLIYGGPHGPF